MSHYIELLVTLGCLAGLMWAMLKFMLKDVMKEIADVKHELTEIKQASLRHEARIDHLYEENNKLYKVLIDLVQKK